MDLDRGDAIRAYLEKNARPLELALYDFHLRGGGAARVLDALREYQNADGGFGKALESDLRLPHSTALATWAALRIMDEVGSDAGNDTLRRGLDYLRDTYEAARPGWAIVRPEVDDHPHAPWWGYATAMAGFGWGNPSAELLGFFSKYGGTGAAGMVGALTRKALARIEEVEPAQFHEVANFKALYDLADEELRPRLRAPLERLIVGATGTDPDAWREYSATPLTFIAAPTDPFAGLFDARLIARNLDFLRASLVGGDHWEPNWDWSGTYPDDWARARREWSGVLTLRNLLTLRAFGVYPLRAEST